MAPGYGNVLFSDVLEIVDLVVDLEAHVYDILLGDLLDPGFPPTLLLPTCLCS